MAEITTHQLLIIAPARSQNLLVGSSVANKHAYSKHNHAVLFLFCILFIYHMYIVNIYIYIYIYLSVQSCISVNTFICRTFVTSLSKLCFYKKQVINIADG